MWAACPGSQKQGTATARMGSEGGPHLLALCPAAQGRERSCPCWRQLLASCKSSLAVCVSAWRKTEPNPRQLPWKQPVPHTGKCRENRRGRCQQRGLVPFGALQP